MTAIEGAAVGKRTAPQADDPVKPAWPTQLGARAWGYTARMAVSEFRRDHCSDLAAGLTYHAIGAAIPALAVVLALVGLIGDPERTADTIVDLISEMGQEEVAEDLRAPITSVATSRAAGLALVFGAAGALWSASGYVSAFGRAMNRIYEIDEGRPFVKRRAINLAVTLLALVGSTVLLLSVAGTRPVARAVGEQVGLGDTFVTVWNVGRWPLMLTIMSVLVALLYYATPNIRQPKFRWLSIGAALAMLIWVAGSVGFAIYVNRFGSYDKTYGSLAGVFILLLWLHLTNQALLFGAEFNAELERARELEAGIEAEEVLQLPPRNTEGSEKAARKLAEDVARGRELRRHSERARRIATRRAPTTDVPSSSVAGRLLGAAVLIGALFTRPDHHRGR